MAAHLLAPVGITTTHRWTVNLHTRQDTPEDIDDSCLHGIALAELVAFLEDMRSDEESVPIFKLTEIAQLYKVRLEQLGLAVEKRIHTTRLKKRLLSALPDLRGKRYSFQF